MNARFTDLSNRGRIRASGEDRKRLLHAMTTNHVQQLEPGQGLYAFFLNAQGRILGDAVLLCEEESILLCVEPETREKLFEHLDRFIIADDVTLEDITASTAEIAVEGSDAPELLQGLGLAVPAAEFHSLQAEGVLVARTSVASECGFRLIVPSADLGSWAERLSGAGAAPMAADEFETARIHRGTPRYGADITESNLLQETDQMHAVHSSKGCYLGQEIVERVRARGHVNKTLVHMKLSAPDVPPPGTPIQANDKEVGAITSAARAADGIYALGYLRVEARKDASSLRALGEPVELLQH